MPWDVVAARLALALFLGIIIGLERQLRQNTAGLRMNSLVAIGSASFVIFGNSISLDGISTHDSLARIAGQIVTGIGFLGGGVIMREGASIRGIATAATLWCSAAVGMFAGAGLLQEAIACTFFIVTTNLALRPLAWIIKQRIELPCATHTHNGKHAYALNVTCHGESQDRIRAMLLQEIDHGELHLHKLESKQAKAGELELEVMVTSLGGRDHTIEHIVSHMSLQPSVMLASWREEQLAA